MITRSFLIRLLPLVALLAAPVVGVSAAQPASRPNVVMVFIDDMGWADLSCFGGTAVQTTEIDRLASEGLRLTNFYVNSPICSPSRTALTTGHYPARHHITSYLAKRELNDRRGMDQWLSLRAPTLPRMLAAAGYATGHFGKWHMGGQRDVGEAPLVTEYGFDASLTNFEGLGPRVLPLCDAYDGTEPHRHDLGSGSLGRGPIQWMDRSQITAEFTRAAIEFIDQSQQDSKPFYVNVWPDDVHSPFFPPRGERGDEQKRTLYHAVLKTMDGQLGVLFDRIRNDPKLRQNTLIVLASDNGHEEGAGQAGPLRGSKGNLYEGGIRSPLIVWGPGLVAADAVGSVNDTTIASSIDVVASLIDLLNVPTPLGYHSDGEILTDALLGKSQRQRSQPLFWRRPPDRPGTKRDPLPDLAVRDGDWKLLCNIDGSGVQLYNLTDDIGESDNLADQHPELTTRLKSAVLQWNDSMPKDAIEGGDPDSVGSLPADKFVNPIAEGADPSVVKHGDHYLWCQSDGNTAISISKSDRLHRLGTKHIIWRAPESGPYSKEVWAPQLVSLDDRWYVYFAASDGQNINHKTYVLASKTDDPLGEYELHGPLYTGDDFETKQNNRWAIDMTVLEHDGRRYAIWSGWDTADSDQQYLYAAPLKSPVEIAGPRVQICDNDDFLWERTEETPPSRGLHEGPEVLQHGDRTFLVYSCGASWLPTYKLGLLELVGDDPLQPADWKKFVEPVFRGTEWTYGVGHGSFTQSPDGTQWWHVYHAKRDREPGWRRGIFVQPMQWGKNGLPRFGQPVRPGQALDVPSGSPTDADANGGKWDLGSAADQAKFDYFGHHQMMVADDDGMTLGVTVNEAVNPYRSGEKLIARDVDLGDQDVSATFEFVDGQRDAGILFRVSAGSVGYDAQRGYFAGMVPRSGQLILGKTDGAGWQHLGDAAVDIDRDEPQTIRVRAVGDQIEVFTGDDPAAKISVRDQDYHRGTVGIRVVDTTARFRALQVQPLSENREP